MTQHVMLDIETMGTTPGCVVLSIGATTFKLDDSPHYTQQTFFKVLNLTESLELGLRIESSTLKWWLTQNHQTLKNQLMEDGAFPLPGLLEIFNEWLSDNMVECVWGNSASFDCGLLRAVYEAAKVRPYWSHRNEMCYRTVKNLCPEIPLAEKDGDRAHDPVYDAQYQIQYLKKVINHLNIKL